VSECEDNTVNGDVTALTNCGQRDAGGPWANLSELCDSTARQEDHGAIAALVDRREKAAQVRGNERIMQGAQGRLRRQSQHRGGECRPQIVHITGA